MLYCSVLCCPIYKGFRLCSPSGSERTGLDPSAIRIPSVTTPKNACSPQPRFAPLCFTRPRTAALVSVNRSVACLSACFRLRSLDPAFDPCLSCSPLCLCLSLGAVLLFTRPWMRFPSSRQPPFPPPRSFWTRSRALSSPVHSSRYLSLSWVS